jgi:hypothetical protein
MAYKQGRGNTPVFFVPVANCLFLIGTAVLTAWGRMDPG